jgi:hypothetical protein
MIRYNCEGCIPRTCATCGDEPEPDTMEPKYAECVGCGSEYETKRMIWDEHYKGYICSVCEFEDKGRTV